VSHELPQEIGDYLLLTTSCGLSTSKALFLNFLSGMWIFLGVFLVYLIEIRQDTLGYLLALGGGVYIQIGACEALPRVTALLESMDDEKYGSRSVIAFTAFVVGAGLIALVLINHSHCGV
jgi:zinc transporter ZupT